MIIVYKIITTILYPFLFLFLFLRKLKKKEDPKRFKEKILVSHFNIKNPTATASGGCGESFAV